MKKFVVTILGVSVLGLVGSVSASGAPTATQSPEPANLTLSAEVVNDIAVPLDVLLSVQTQYQGFAVTGAAKVSRNGQQAYRLRVDRNDMPNDNNSFYLLYDMNWKLVGEEKIVQPPQKAEPKKPEQPQQPADKPKEESETPEPRSENTAPAQTTANTETSTESSQPTNATNNPDNPSENQTPTPPSDNQPTSN